MLGHQLQVVGLTDEDSEKNELIEFGLTHGLIGESPRFLHLLAELKHYREFSEIVLLEGETGTGKELAAKALHGTREGAYVALNCGDMIGEMARLEVAGYGKKTFTGSDSVDRNGCFVEAKGGTLFLDEIQLLSKQAQQHFLRVLQEGRIRPIGAHEEVGVSDTRVVVASNENLELMVEQGKLRKDLYYRVSVLVISVPSLRERIDDVEMLAKHFIAKHQQRLRSSAQSMSEEAVLLLKNHTWPGNIRELENVIKGILVRKQNGSRIEIPDLLRFESLRRAQKAYPLDEQMIEFQQQFHNPMRLETGYRLVEHFLMSKAIQASNGNQSEAAKSLGITREKLRQRLEEYDIPVERTNRIRLQ